MEVMIPNKVARFYGPRCNCDQNEKVQRRFTNKLKGLSDNCSS